VDVEQLVFNKETMTQRVQQHADTAMEKHLNITRDHEDFLAAANRSVHEVSWDNEHHPGCKYMQLQQLLQYCFMQFSLIPSVTL
jgi:hypothetical protein